MNSSNARATSLTTPTQEVGQRRSSSLPVSSSLIVSGIPSFTANVGEPEIVQVVLPCLACDERFDAEKDRDRHRMLHHRDHFGVGQCILCPEEYFPDKFKFKIHFEQAHPQELNRLLIEVARRDISINEIQTWVVANAFIVNDDKMKLVITANEATMDCMGYPRPQEMQPIEERAEFKPNIQIDTKGFPPTTPAPLQDPSGIIEEPVTIQQLLNIQFKKEGTGSELEMADGQAEEDEPFPLADLSPLRGNSLDQEEAGDTSSRKRDLNEPDAAHTSAVKKLKQGNTILSAETPEASVQPSPTTEQGSSPSVPKERKNPCRMAKARAVDYTVTFPRINSKSQLVKNWAKEGPRAKTSANNAADSVLAGEKSCNAFLIYYETFRDEIEAEHPRMFDFGRQQLAMKEWLKMTADERAFYEEQADIGLDTDNLDEGPSTSRGLVPSPPPHACSLSQPLMPQRLQPREEPPATQTAVTVAVPAAAAGVTAPATAAAASAAPAAAPSSLLLLRRFINRAE